MQRPVRGDHTAADDAGGAAGLAAAGQQGGEPGPERELCRGIEQHGVGLRVERDLEADVLRGRAAAGTVPALEPHAELVRDEAQPGDELGVRVAVVEHQGRHLAGRGPQGDQAARDGLELLGRAGEAGTTARSGRDGDGMPGHRPRQPAF